MVLAITLPIVSIAGNGEPNKKSIMVKWIEKNVSYPNSAIENREEGIVYVSFTVSADGKTENIGIESGVFIALNQEAIKVVERLPLDDSYNERDTDKVYILPIKFTLK